MNVSKQLLIGVFFICSLSQFSLAAKHAPPLEIGASLPDFKLPGVDGKNYTPADFKEAQALVMIFTCNHCPTAQAYEERIKKLRADYKSKGVAVLAINPNHAESVRLDELAYTDLGDTLEEMQVRAEYLNYNFPYVDDGPEQVLSEQFGPVATPHVFIFDKERKLRFQGRIDNSERESLVKRHDTRLALDDILAGKEPEIATTKVFGCSIKWKDKVDDNLRWKKKAAAEEVNISKIDKAGLKALRENKGSGKVRMINAWATWCGPCVSEFDEIVETNLRFRYRDFELITVAAQFPDEEPKVKHFLKKKHASMENRIYAQADKYEMMEALDPEWNGALPHTLLINEKGEVIYRETGSLDFLALRRAILPALDAIEPWGGLGDK